MVLECCMGYEGGGYEDFILFEVNLEEEGECLWGGSVL